MKEVYGLNHIIYLEYFIYYSNFPQIVEIIEFRGGFHYEDILPKDTTEAYKISLKEPNKIKHSLENISTYLRKVITVFVENPKLFMETFNITNFYIQWDIEETSFKLKSQLLNTLCKISIICSFLTGSLSIILLSIFESTSCSK